MKKYADIPKEDAHVLTPSDYQKYASNTPTMPVTPPRPEEREAPKNQ